MILRHLFSPLNNTRLSHLCGPTDEHLRTIETALGVRIAHRHEQFKVDGPKPKAQRAMDVLQALYEMAARAIPAATVQLMLSGDGSAEQTDGPALSTRRADLKPRSTNQALYLDNIASHGNCKNFCSKSASTIVSYNICTSIISKYSCTPSIYA